MNSTAMNYIRTNNVRINNKNTITINIIMKYTITNNIATKNTRTNKTPLLTTRKLLNRSRSVCQHTMLKPDQASYSTNQKQYTINIKSLIFIFVVEVYNYILMGMLVRYAILCTFVNITTLVLKT